MIWIDITLSALIAAQAVFITVLSTSVLGLQRRVDALERHELRGYKSR